MSAGERGGRRNGGEWGRSNNFSETPDLKVVSPDSTYQTNSSPKGLLIIQRGERQRPSLYNKVYGWNSGT
jgi:hypothetical protein